MFRSQEYGQLCGFGKAYDEIFRYVDSLDCAGSLPSGFVYRSGKTASLGRMVYMPPVHYGSTHLSTSQRRGVLFSIFILILILFIFRGLGLYCCSCLIVDVLLIHMFNVKSIFVLITYSLFLFIFLCLSFCPYFIVYVPPHMYFHCEFYFCTCDVFFFLLYCVLFFRVLFDRLCLKCEKSRRRMQVCSPT